MNKTGIIWAALVSASLGSCAQEPEIVRVIPERKSVGDSVYKVVCQRFASEELPSDVSGLQTQALCEGRRDASPDDPPRVRAFAAHRVRFVDAINATFPDETHDDLRDFLGAMLPLYEESGLPRQTRAIADVITRVLDDRDALDALARLARREGYHDLRMNLGMAASMMHYPALDDLTRVLLDVTSEDGAAQDEWKDLLTALAFEMAVPSEDQPQTDGEPTTGALVRSILLTQNDAFSQNNENLYVTRRDPRGWALPSEGRLGTVFGDLDADGLADVDGAGWFLDVEGAPLDVAAPFARRGEKATARDAMGRALGTDGRRLFDSFDANRTLLSGLGNEGFFLVDGENPILSDLTAALPVMMGESTAATATYGNFELHYETYDGRGPAFELLHAAGALLSKNDTLDVVRLVEILVQDHEDLIAALIDSAWTGYQAGNTYADASLTERSAFWDDLLEIVRRTADEPGLTEAFLRALADPRSSRIGDVYASFMRNRDYVTYDSGNINRLRLNAVVHDSTDWTQPDTRDNQSLFQRSLSLIHDLNGAQLCNKDGAKLRIYLSGRELLSWPLVGSYDECELLQVDNVAEEFAKAILGRSELVMKDRTLNQLLRLVDRSGLTTTDDVLEQQSEITGLTTHPTAVALARLVFTPRNDFLRSLVDDPLTIDGAIVEDRHAGTVFAWEKIYTFDDGRAPSQSSFYECMVPIIQAFEDHDRRANGRFLFADLISTLHLHWPSTYAGDGATTQSSNPDAPFFAKQSNLRSYEPVVAHVFDGGKLITRLHDLMRVLDAIEVRPGVDGIDVLAAATETAISREGDLSNLAGETEAQLSDGSGSVPYSPIYLLLDAVAAQDRAFEADPTAHERWLRARSELVDRFGRVTRDSDGQYAFDNRTFVEALRIVIPVLRERLTAHEQAGDYSEWALELSSRARTTMTEPVPSAALRLLRALAENPEADRQALGLMRFMLNPESPADARARTLTTLVDLAQRMEGNDVDVRTLLRTLAPAMAEDVDESVRSGIAPSVDAGAVQVSLEVMRDMVDLDEQQILTAMMQNLVEPMDEYDGETPVEALLDILGEANRANVGSGEDFSPEDYESLLRRTRELLENDDRGLERLYRVIQNKELDP